MATDTAHRVGGPLRGLKVIEMAGLGPCPLAGQLLGDLGADVVVIVRHSGELDLTNINDRSKRSLALNLKHPEGIRAALRLIDGADILIEGYRPGVMEKLGLGPEACRQRNPGLIYGRITGWGQHGPLAPYAGHDINYLAITGALAAIGGKGEPPLPPLNLVADYAGGTMFLLLGLLSALFERQGSGIGQTVDAAMVDGVPALMGLIHALLARGHWKDERESNLLDGGAPFYRTYETADGGYVAVGPLEPQFFALLVEKAGIALHHLSDQNDQAHWAERCHDYAAIFRTKSRAEWERVFAGTDACVVPVLGLGEAPSHPHNVARGTFVDVGGVVQAAPAPRFDRTPASQPRAPRAAGGDTCDILREIGYLSDDVAMMKASGVLT